MRTPGGFEKLNLCCIHFAANFVCFPPFWLIFVSIFSALCWSYPSLKILPGGRTGHCSARALQKRSGEKIPGSIPAAAGPSSLMLIIRKMIKDKDDEG